MCPAGRDTIADGTARYYRAGASLALAALCVVASRAQRGLWFIADQRDVLAHFVDGHHFQPYNGHLSVISVLVYQGLAHGLENSIDRLWADALLIADEHVMLRGTTLDARACADAPESIPPIGTEVRPGERYLVTACAPHPVTIRLRRFANASEGTVLGVVPSGAARLLALPRDRSARP